MKNRTVKAMIKTQFNLNDKAEINVEFLLHNDSGYHFECYWFEGDILHQVNCVLPHLSVMTRDMTTGEYLKELRAASDRIEELVK